MPSSSSSAASAAARRGAARRAHRADGGGPFAPPRAPSSLDLGGELGEPVVGAVELVRAWPSLAEERQHVGIGLAVLALQRLQRRDAFPHLLQPLRVGGERLAVVADVARELGGLGRERPCPLGEPRRRRDRGRPPRRARGPRRRGRRPHAIVAGQRRLGRGAGIEQALHVRRAAPPRPSSASVSPGRGHRPPRSPAPGRRAGRARARGRGPPRGGRSSATRAPRSSLVDLADSRPVRRGARRPRTDRGTRSASPARAAAAPGAARAPRRARRRARRAPTRWRAARRRAPSPCPRPRPTRASTTSPSSAHSSAAVGGRVEQRLHPRRAAPVADERGRRLARRARARGPTVIIVLPAPVSPVSTFRPGCSSRSRSSMTPSPRDVELAEHARMPSRALRHRPTRGRRTASGSPGRPNFSRTSERKPGASSRRTSRAGRAEARIRTVDPTGSSMLRATVGREHAALLPHHLERQTWLAGVQHEGAVEDHVRGDRGEHEGIHAGTHDRTPRRERVGGGPGRRGHDHAVGRERRHVGRRRPAPRAEPGGAGRASRP